MKKRKKKSKIYFGTPVHDAIVKYNNTKNVMGLMPHPERAFETFHITQDGFKLLDNFME